MDIVIIYIPVLPSHRDCPYTINQCLVRYGRIVRIDLCRRALQTGAPVQTYWMITVQKEIQL